MSNPQSKLSDIRDGGVRAGGVSPWPAATPADEGNSKLQGSSSTHANGATRIQQYTRPEPLHALSASAMSAQFSSNAVAQVLSQVASTGAAHQNHAQPASTLFTASNAGSSAIAQQVGNSYTKAKSQGQSGTPTRFSQPTMLATPPQHQRPQMPFSGSGGGARPFSSPAHNAKGQRTQYFQDVGGRSLSSHTRGNVQMQQGSPSSPPQQYHQHQQMQMPQQQYQTYYFPNGGKSSGWGQNIMASGGNSGVGSVGSPMHPMLTPPRPQRPHTSGGGRAVTNASPNGGQQDMNGVQNGNGDHAPSHGAVNGNRSRRLSPNRVRVSDVHAIVDPKPGFMSAEMRKVTASQSFRSTSRDVLALSRQMRDEAAIAASPQAQARLRQQQQEQELTNAANFGAQFFDNGNGNGCGHRGGSPGAGNRSPHEYHGGSPTYITPHSTHGRGRSTSPSPNRSKSKKDSKTKMTQTFLKRLDQECSTDVSLLSAVEASRGKHDIVKSRGQIIDTFINGEVVMRDAINFTMGQSEDFHHELVGAVSEALPAPPIPSIIRFASSLAESDLTFIETVMASTAARLFSQGWTVYRADMVECKLTLLAVDSENANGPKRPNTNQIFRLVHGRGIIIKALKQESSVIVGDAKADNLYSAQFDRGCCATACCRLFDAKGNTNGVIQFCQFSSGAPTLTDKQHRTLVEDAAVMISLAFNMKSAQEDVSLLRRELELVRECVGEVGGNPELSGVLFEVEGLIMKKLNCDYATVWIVDSKTKDLWAQDVLNGIVRLIRPNLEKAGNMSLQGQCLDDNTTTQIDDCAHDSRWKPYAELDCIGETLVRTVLLMPLKTHAGFPIGVLQAVNKRAPAKKKVSVPVGVADALALTLAHTKPTTGSILDAVEVATPKGGVVSAGGQHVGAGSAVDEDTAPLPPTPFDEADVHLLNTVAFAAAPAIESTELFNVRREYGFEEGEPAEHNFWIGRETVVNKKR